MISAESEFGAATPPIVVIEIFDGEISRRMSFAWLGVRLFLMFTSFMSVCFMLRIIPLGVAMDDLSWQLKSSPLVSIRRPSISDGLISVSSPAPGGKLIWQGF